MPPHRSLLVAGASLALVAGLVAAVTLDRGADACAPPAAGGTKAAVASGGVRSAATVMQRRSRPAPMDAGKLMVVGDSLSHGTTGDWTWRYRLHLHLVDNRVQVDFVGPRSDLDNRSTPTNLKDGDHSYAYPVFDQDHNAETGRPYGFEAHAIGPKVAAYRPDTMLVLLGLNDLAWYRIKPDKVEVSLRTFVANARAAKPKLRLVLGTVMPTLGAEFDTTVKAAVADFNRRLAAAAAELSTAVSPIVVADTAAGFRWKEHTWDGTHPNARGELLIASAFADALAERFGIGAPFPRPLPEVVAGPHRAPKLQLASTPPHRAATLSWALSPGATDYAIWTRDDVTNDDWTKVATGAKAKITTTSTLTRWHVKELTPGATYRFRVQPMRGTAGGAYSNEVTLHVPGPKPMPRKKPPAATSASARPAPSTAC